MKTSTLSHFAGEPQALAPAETTPLGYFMPIKNGADTKHDQGLVAIPSIGRPLYPVGRSHYLDPGLFALHLTALVVTLIMVGHLGKRPRCWWVVPVVAVSMIDVFAVVIAEALAA